MSRFLALYAALIYVFLHAPLLVLAVFSFNDSRFTEWTGFSTRWYDAAVHDAQLVEATRNSLVIAGVSAALATAVGTLCAYALWKRSSPVISGALYLSLLTPEIIMGVSLLAFFQWLFRFGGLQLGMHTVIAAHVMFCLAWVVLAVSARLRMLDPALEEAAMDLGAGPWMAFRAVTLPQLWPGVLAAGLLAFTVSFDDYVITSMVAGVDSETLPMVIYALARRGANPVVNAVSTLVVAALGAIILLSSRLSRA